MNAEDKVNAQASLELPETLKRDGGKEIVQTSEDVGAEILAKDAAV